MGDLLGRLYDVLNGSPWTVRVLVLLTLALLGWSCATELNWACGPEGSCP